MTAYSPIDPPSKSKRLTGAPRNAKRTRVLMNGTLVTPSGSLQVRVRDISMTGAQVIGPKDLPVGCDAVLHRGSLFAAARIAWRKGDEVGLKFYRELSPEEIDSSLPSSLLRDRR
jgi:hypothetical protein